MNNRRNKWFQSWVLSVWYWCVMYIRKHRLECCRFDWSYTPSFTTEILLLLLMYLISLELITCCTYCTHNIYTQSVYHTKYLSFIMPVTCNCHRPQTRHRWAQNDSTTRRRQRTEGENIALNTPNVTICDTLFIWVFKTDHLSILVSVQLWPWSCHNDMTILNPIIV